jgi:hypothetical protein
MKGKRDVPAYGFAVKINDEKGNVIANFPLVNFPLFPINSVSTFLKLFTSVNRFCKKMEFFFFTDADFKSHSLNMLRHHSSKIYSDSGGREMIFFFHLIFILSVCTDWEII